MSFSPNLNKIVIIGAGGHGQVVADILLRQKECGMPVSPVCFLDDDESLIGKTILGLPVKGKICQIDSIAHDGVIVAIGDNRKRKAIFKSLHHNGTYLATACHPSAVVAPDVSIGEGCMICAGVIINPGSKIGDNVILNTGCSVDHHDVIGDHVHIAPGVHIGGDVIVGNGSLVGIGGTVMPGRRVGNWSIIGAGGLVTKDIPDGAVAYGVPATLNEKNNRL